MSETKIYHIEEIMQMLPHRYPFLLVDRLEVEIPGEKGVGIKNVTMNEEFFQGHFPGNPVMPGVLQIEAMAQTAGAIVVAGKGDFADKKRSVLFMSIDGVKFRKPVKPERFYLLSRIMSGFFVVAAAEQDCAGGMSFAAL